MLETPTIDRQFTSEVSAYLHDTLGAEPRIRPWDDLRKLPYFLQDAFDLYDFELNGRSLVLASPREPSVLKLGALRAKIDSLVDVVGRPAVFAVSTLASYERKRLVEQKIPFVVPGNQLYLPDLGIDFREYFRQPTRKISAFTPATQAMFIAALLRKEWRGEWQPTDVVADLGYTAMTLSRSVRELTAAGLIAVRQEGRVRLLQPAHEPAEAWAHAKPFLRSPVKRTVWVGLDARVILPQAPLAGLSALAASSMLVEPPRPIFAVSTAQWKVAQQSGVRALSESHPDSLQWEVWTYAPNLQKEQKTVDPLSLTLSLQDQQDERVQQALEDLQGQFPW